ETMRYPRNTRKQSVILHAGRRRGNKAKHDFRLDLGLGVGRERQGHGKVLHRAVVDIAPDRRTNAVFIPHPAVGKSDLAAKWLVALRDALVVSKRCHTIGVTQSESWIARGERQHMSPTAVERSKCLVRDFTNGCLVGRGTRYGSFSHALLPASSAHRFYIARDNDRFSKAANRLDPHSIEITFCPAIFDRYILVFEISGFL